MRSLLLTVVAAILLCLQLPHIVVSAKKPSRRLPNGQRPPTKPATVGTKGKPQRPLSRKVPPPSEEEEVDEFDSLDVLPPDDDDDEDRDVATQTRPRNSPPPKKPPLGRQNARNSGPKNQNRPPPSVRLSDDDADDDDDKDEIVEDDYDDEEEEEEEEEEDEYTPPPTRQQQRGRPGRIQQRPAFVVGDRRPRTHQSQQQQQQRQPSRNGRNHNSSRPGPPRREGRNSGGRVVPYRKPSPNGAAAVFAQGWSGLVSALPDPSIVKEAAISSLNAAKQTTSSLSANIYREVKGLTSSELEQVMLKATRPDDTAVKGKHVERLVGVTYQISARYDIYDAVLRKLWSKMAEKDWRTTIKALYILHRFAADGSPEHAVALKTRLRELRRTRDPKRKDKFFNSKQLIAGETTPENVKFRAFMARYAHYVLLRAQYFSGMFEEISSVPPARSEGKKKTPPKPITATSLRGENYNAAELLLKAGLACHLKDGEICENTAIAAERVAADMMGLTSAVAVALNRVLKDSIPKGTDQKLIQQWCTLYSQHLLPQTKAMVKKMSPNLDAFGLFLPSRMSASVPPNLLEKGLKLATNGGEGSPDEVPESVDAETIETNAPVAMSSTKTLSENDTNEKDNVPKAKTSTVPVDDDDAVDTAVEDEEEEDEEVEDEEYEYDDEDGDEDDEEEYEEGDD